MIEKRTITELIDKSISVKQKLQGNVIDVIHQSALICVEILKNNNKLLICGNGGSAADSQHFACELTGRFIKERKGLPAIALTTDTSFLTAWSNDYSFDTIFSRQVEALGNKGDLLFAISTSGNSDNCIEALNKAKEMGITTISLLGKDGGMMKDLSDYAIVVPDDTTFRIQESHIMIIHIICYLIEQEL